MPDEFEINATLRTKIDLVRYFFRQMYFMVICNNITFIWVWTFLRMLGQSLIKKWPKTCSQLQLEPCEWSNNNKKGIIYDDWWFQLITSNSNDEVRDVPFHVVAVTFRWKLANLIGDLFWYSVSQLKNYKTKCDTGVSNRVLRQHIPHKSGCCLLSLLRISILTWVSILILISIIGVVWASWDNATQNDMAEKVNQQ